MRSQLAPPSRERKVPPLLLAASATAYTTLGFAGDIESPMRPKSSVGNPDCDLFHVLPPSVERYTAEPGPPAMNANTRRLRCHIGATSMSGLRGSSWMSFAPVQSSTKRQCDHLSAPSLALESSR